MRIEILTNLEDGKKIVRDCAQKFYVLSPYNPADYTLPSDNLNSSQKTISRISIFLADLGVPPASEGFSCLVAAISILLRDNFRSKNLSKDIYPEIAEITNHTVPAVERNIRTAVKYCHQSSKYTKIFNTASRVTNKTFVITLASLLANDITVD